MTGINILKIRSIAIVTIVVAVGIVIAISRACSVTVAEVAEEQEERYELNRIVKDEYSANECFAPMEKYIARWMARNEIKGATLAIMKDERLIYCKGLGWADEQLQREAEAGDIYRMASASKLITAIAVMKLTEEGKLSLDDKVFGEEGILSQFTTFRDKRAANITVRHLLNHTSGFSRRQGDLMFRINDVINWAELDHSPSADEIIDYQLRLRLRDNPGGSAQYSNVGYLVLSRVIEAASGEEYEQYVKKHVLEPAGCYDMHIAHNFYEERYPNEVRYYGHDEGEVIPSYDNSGNMYPREYGGNNIRGLQGAGGWVASSAEMMRLVASIDGKDGVPDILSPKSIKAMSIPSREGGFGFGWARCSAKSNTLVRTGTMSGTCAYIEYNPKGYSFVLITNTSHYRGARFTQSAGNTIKEGIRRVKEFPEDVDLFVAIPQPEEVQSDEKSEEAKE